MADQQQLLIVNIPKYCYLIQRVDELQAPIFNIFKNANLF